MKSPWLLVVMGAASAAVILACGHGPYGVTFVGPSAEGKLIAYGVYDQGGEWRRYESADGGLSWQHTATLQGTNHPLWRNDRPLEAVTPRGNYQIIKNGRKITRTVDGRSHTVYSIDDLLDGANQIVSIKDRKNVGDKFHSIHFDAASSNIIVAVETDGVIVETPDGRLSRVEVGPWTPTRFPVASRMKLLVTTPTVWLSILSIIVTFSATAFLLAVSRWPEILLGTGLSAAICTAYFLTYGMIVDDNILPLIMIVLGWPVIMVILFALLEFIVPGSGPHRSIGLLAVGFVLAGAVFGFPGFPGKSLLLAVWVFPYLYLPMIAASLTLVVTATRPYLPVGEDWRKPAIATLIGMLLALLVPVILWLLYILTQETAHAVSVTLASALALAWFGYLKRRQYRRRASG